MGVGGEGKGLSFERDRGGGGGGGKGHSNTDKSLKCGNAEKGVGVEGGGEWGGLSFERDGGGGSGRGQRPLLYRHVTEMCKRGERECLTALIFSSKWSKIV